MPFTLLLTRPQPQSERFARQCRARFGDALPVVISPILAIKTMGRAPDLTAYRGVILTSENGAHALGQSVSAEGLVAYCVGDRTSEVAGRYGMASQVCGGTALALVETLQMGQGPLLHIRGVHARGDVARQLTAAGVQTDEAVLYDQVPCALSDDAQAILAGSEPVLLPLFSPRSAALVSAAATDATAPLLIASMSGTVAAAWAGPAPFRHEIAARPDADAMLECLERLAAALP